MLVLHTDDQILGDTSSASTVDYTLHGLVNNDLAVLGTGQLETTTGSIYQASSTDVAVSMTIVNTSNSSVDINLYLQESGEDRRSLFPVNMTLDPHYSVFTDFASLYIYDDYGQLTYNHDADTVDGKHASELGAFDRIVYTASEFISACEDSNVASIFVKSTNAELEITENIDIAYGTPQVKYIKGEHAFDSEHSEGQIKLSNNSHFKVHGSKHTNFENLSIYNDNDNNNCIAKLDDSGNGELIFHNCYLAAAPSSTNPSNYLIEGNGNSINHLMFNHCLFENYQHSDLFKNISVSKGIKIVGSTGEQNTPDANEVLHIYDHSKLDSDTVDGHHVTQEVFITGTENFLQADDSELVTRDMIKAWVGDHDGNLTSLTGEDKTFSFYDTNAYDEGNEDHHWVAVPVLGSWSSGTLHPDDPISVKLYDDYANYKKFTLYKTTSGVYTIYADGTDRIANSNQGQNGGYIINDTEDINASITLQRVYIDRDAISGETQFKWVVESVVGTWKTDNGDIVNEGGSGVSESISNFFEALYIEPNGTNGQSFTGGTWNECKFNTVESGAGVSWASLNTSTNEITLAPGSYKVEAQIALGADAGYIKTRIKHVGGDSIHPTDDTLVGLGCFDASGYSSAPSSVNAFIVTQGDVGSDSVIKVQNYVNNSQWQHSEPDGEKEKYNQIIIQKLS